MIKCIHMYSNDMHVGIRCFCSFEELDRLLLVHHQRIWRDRFDNSPAGMGDDYIRAIARKDSRYLTTVVQDCVAGPVDCRLAFGFENNVNCAGNPGGCLVGVMQR